MRLAKSAGAPSDLKAAARPAYLQGTRRPDPGELLMEAKKGGTYVDIARRLNARYLYVVDELKKMGYISPKARMTKEGTPVLADPQEFPIRRPAMPPELLATAQLAIMSNNNQEFQGALSRIMRFKESASEQYEAITNSKDKDPETEKQLLATLMYIASDQKQLAKRYFAKGFYDNYTVLSEEAEEILAYVKLYAGSMRREAARSNGHAEKLELSRLLSANPGEAADIKDPQISIAVSAVSALKQQAAEIDEKITSGDNSVDLKIGLMKKLEVIVKGEKALAEALYSKGADASESDRAAYFKHADLWMENAQALSAATKAKLGAFAGTADAGAV